MSNVRHVLLAIVVLSAAPLAFAHLDGGVPGTPKAYCELPPSPWWPSNPDPDLTVHDYGTYGVTFDVASNGGATRAGPRSGGASPAAQIPAVAGPASFGDGNVEDCDGDGIPFDYDGHREFAYGGAFLSVCDNVVLSCFEPGGGGSQACHGEVAHHPLNWWLTIRVVDTVLTPMGAPVRFAVATDTVHNHPPLPGVPDCGDLESDYGFECMDACEVRSLPGLDGGYHVFVTGFQGHVTGHDLAACFDGVDSDGDGADYPLDPGCTSYSDPTEADDGPAQCADGIDNDLDGYVDWEQDGGCRWPMDPYEWGS